MGEITGISWTDHTFNPWWGCWKIADECKNCYADSTAHRFVDEFGELWGRTAGRRFFGDTHWSEPIKWNRKAERDRVRRRVFCGSMCDWAEAHPDDEINAQQNAARARLWNLIAATPWLDWLLLTKRPDDAANMLPWTHPQEVYDRHAIDPWPNVWVGVTAGTRESVSVNVSILRSIPAVVRFVSCEPILEDIPADEWDRALGEGMGKIDWLIVGDESGHNARPAQPDWVRGAREASLRHGVAFHFKQWAGRDVYGITGSVPGAERKGRKIHLPILDGKQWAQFPNQEQSK